MYFEQFYLTCLSHASYMLASGGIAAVVDPQRDVDIYLDEARKHGFEIRYVIETHLHADFVSGHGELAARTGAQIYLGATAGARFPHTGVRQGDELSFGHVRLRFLETPGHTVESICILITDLERSPEPFAVLTGDTLFIGDVGRPDLSGDRTPQQLAGMLYDSLQERLLTLPDEVEVYPAHGAGSLCGRSLGQERRSTIGRERQQNYALQARSREEFIHLLTGDLPERPAYFSADVELNRSGASSLDHLTPLPRLTPAEVREAASRGVLLLDTRPANEFAAAHIPGSLHVGLGGQFASWAGILIGTEQEVVLIGEDDERVSEARLRLARVGIEKAAGYLAGGLPAWVAAGLPVQDLAQVTAAQLRSLLREANPGTVQILDVRRRPEWDAGHLDEALLNPLDKLVANLQTLNPEQLTVVHCKGGYRSAIACSILQRAGFEQVANLIGGYDAYQAAIVEAARAGAVH